jgi:hypothetical protein
VIVDVAGLTSVTLNLILAFVDATHPDTAPAVSVPPAEGIATLVTAETGFKVPALRLIALGAVADIAALGAEVTDDGSELKDDEAELPPPHAESSNAIRVKTKMWLRIGALKRYYFAIYH